MAGRPKLTDDERASRKRAQIQRRQASVKSPYEPGQRILLNRSSVGDAPLDQGGETGDNRSLFNLGSGSRWFVAREQYM